MKKAALLAAVPVALALIACDKVPTSPQQLSPRLANHAVLLNDRETDILLSTVNTCNGDVVSGTGNIHQVVQQTIDANGGAHFGLKTQFTNIKLTGAPSGASYVSKQVGSSEQNIGPGETVTEGVNFSLNGRGTTPNLIFHALLHTTVNANGIVTSLVDNLSIECH